MTQVNGTKKEILSEICTNIHKQKTKVDNNPKEDLKLEKIISNSCKIPMEAQNLRKSDFIERPVEKNNSFNFKPHTDIFLNEEIVLIFFLLCYSIKSCLS